MKQSFKRSFMFVLTLLALTFSALGVTPAQAATDLNLTWNTFLGSTTAERVRGVAVDSAHNSYVVGTSNGTWGSPVRPYSGSDDVWVAKLDSNGNLLWNTFLGSSGPEIAGFSSIAVDGSGNVYVAASSNATWGTPLAPHNGNWDMFLAKLNGSDGALIWHTFKGGSGVDYGMGVAVSSGGAIFVGGEAGSTWGSPVNPFGGGSSDAFVAKFASDGSPTWVSFAGGSSNESGYTLALDGAGNPYVAGIAGGTWGTPTRAYSGGADGMVAAFNGSTGALVGNTFMGGAGDEYIYGITFSGTDMYLAGTGNASWGAPVRAHGGGNEGFAVRATNTGALTWNTFLGGSGDDRAYQVGVFNNDVYVAFMGSSVWGCGSPCTVRAFSGSYDIGVAKLDNSGNLVLNTFIGGAGYEENAYMALDNAGDIYLAGRSDATWGAPVRAFVGPEDGMVAKLDNAYVVCSNPATVTSNADSGAGTLRQALTDVCAGGTINFNSSLSGGTITLTSKINIAKNMTIDSSALASQVTVSGGGSDGMFVVDPGITATFNNMTFANGNVTAGPNGDGRGGAIRNTGILTVNNSTFSGNHVNWAGGAIYNDPYQDPFVPILTIKNSTFTNNSSNAYGGAVANQNGTLTISNSTFSGNSGATGGGLANMVAGSVATTIYNSTFSGNTAASGGGIWTNGASSNTLSIYNTILANSTADVDCNKAAPITVAGNNNIIESGNCGTSITSDPNLDTLGLLSNGGPTQTIALLTGSPAINAGDDAVCAAVPVSAKDQRGTARPIGTTCDIGAYESSLVEPSAFAKSSPADSATGVSVSPTLSWGASSGASGYEYCYDTTNDNACSSWTSVASASASPTLSTGTTYYWHVRAVNGGSKTYADGSSTAYWSFTTQTLVPATVTTQAVSEIGINTATGNGNLTSLGIPNPTAYGVVYGTSSTPTIAGSKVDKGAASATGAFTASMTGLSANTTYYVRAFATNTFGTVYGGEVSFTTDSTLSVTGPSSVTYGSTGTITTSGGSSGGALSYAGSGGCTVDSSSGEITVTSVSAGPCAVTATRAAGGAYVSQTSATYNVTLNKANQAAVTLSGVPSNPNVGDTFTAAASGGSGTGAYSYALTGTACTLDTSSGAGSIIHVSGGCSVTASRAGDGNYNASAASFASVVGTIGKGTQATVTLSGIPSTPNVGDTFTAAASGGSGTGAYSYALTGTACTLDTSSGAGSIIHVSGGCSVTASRAGDNDYNASAASSASVVGTIGKGTQATVTLSGVPGTAYVSQTFTAAASGGTVGAYSYAVTGTACTIDPSTGAGVVMQTSGGCSVTASRAGDSDYNIATSSASAITTIYDNPRPTVQSIALAGMNPIDGTGLDFTVTFSEPVTGVDKADFSVTKTGSIMGAAVTKVVAVSTNVYTVTVNSGIGNGSIRLDLPATATIQDLFAPASASFAGPYTGGPTYSAIDGHAPTVPVLKLPLSNSLVASYTPTLDWSDSSQVMALAMATGWHYEIQVTAPFGVYNETFNTAENADPALGLGASTFTIPADKSLPANKTFTWRVRAFDGSYRYSAWSKTLTFRTKLATPALTSPLEATLDNTRPTFSWDAVPGAATYTLQVLKDGKVVVTGTIKAPAASYTPTKDLFPSATYTWKVKANGVNSGDYSSPRTFTTGASAPAIPVLTAPKNGIVVDSASAQTLEWSLVDNTTPAISFEVEYANNAAFTSSVPAVVPAPTKTLSIGPLSGGTYYWHVRSWSEADAKGTHSAWSATRTIKVSGAEPISVAPTVPLLRLPANNSLVASYTPTLDWNNSTPKVMAQATGWHYEIQVTAPFGVYNETFNTTESTDPVSGLGESTFTIPEDKSLPANKTFTWRVRAYNGTELYSAWSAPRTFRTKLANPILVSPVDDPDALTPLDNKRPTFIWEPVSGAATYTLQVLKDGKVVVTGTIKAPAYSYTPAKDLFPNTTYTWQVKANGTNTGVYSTPFTFMTGANAPAIPVLTAPVSGVLVDGAVEQTLIWKSGLLPSDPAAVSYEVEYATNAAFTESTIVPAADTQLLLSSGTLLPGRTYYWRVRSWSEIDAKGTHSPWSLVRTIKVKFVAPTLTTPIEGATESLNPTFTWSSNNGLWTTYTLQIATDADFKVGLKNFTIKAPVTTFTLPTASALKEGTYYWRVKINGAYTPIASASQSFIVP